jgi:hypothetical protein
LQEITPTAAVVVDDPLGLSPRSSLNSNDSFLSGDVLLGGPDFGKQLASTLETFARERRGSRGIV